MDAPDTTFDAIADRLSANSLGVSVIRRLRGTPDYDAIVSLGGEAITPLLNRLQDAGSRPLWLSLLSDITGEAALPGKTETIDDAAAAWLDWGRANGFWPANA